MPLSEEMRKMMRGLKVSNRSMNVAGRHLSLSNVNKGGICDGDDLPHLLSADIEKSLSGRYTNLGEFRSSIC